MLDVCQRCRGVWFDHHELATIWRLNLDQAIARRSVAGSPALDTGADVLSYALLWSPELVGEGAVGLAQAGAGAIEVVGGAADGVFESVIAIIESLF